MVSCFSFAFAVLQLFPLPLPISPWTKSSVFCHGSYLILVHLGIPGWKKERFGGGQAVERVREGGCVYVYIQSHSYMF